MRCAHVIEKREVTAYFGRTACLCLLIITQSAGANPTGGKVTSGSATITNTGNTTTIHQTSKAAIINWQGFSIGANQTTQFIDSSSSGITLNRVTGGSASQIYGTLKSNGTIYLINPNGILFGAGSTVDVGGLVASTSQISDKSFLSGNMQFTPGNNPNASIVNDGHISIKNAGLAVLVSPTVINNGIIQANMGTVVIAGATHFTLDPYGDNLITFDAGPVTSKEQVTNAGKIIANGGKVLLTAQATGSMVENVINMNGYIEAKAVNNKNGTVVLQGYDNSTVNVNGTINVAGTGNNQTGGNIAIGGDTIQLGNQAFLNAAGSIGGGNVLVGSDIFHGQLANSNGQNILGQTPWLTPAQYTYVEPGAQINANSLASGNAGNVEIWGGVANEFSGSISAQALGATGNGGNVETSGDYLSISGARVNTTSANGHVGQWLLDPIDVNITNSPTSNGSFGGGNPDTFTPTTQPANIYVGDINSNLLTTNVIVSTGSTGAANGDVTFTNTTPISWSTPYSFTVNAAGSIIFNAPGD